MNTFTTRALAVDFLVSQGLVMAFAKVAVKETFDLGPDSPADDFCWKLKGDDIVQVQPSEVQLIECYNEVVANKIDVDEQGISIYGELKYDLNGDLYMDDHEKPEQPKVPEQPTVPAPTTQQ
jgi:hypothetical protein